MATGKLTVSFFEKMYKEFEIMSILPQEAGQHFFKNPQEQLCSPTPYTNIVSVQ